MPPPPPPPPYVLPEPATATRTMSTDTADRVIHALARAWAVPVRVAYRSVAGPFPLAGPAHWSDDWHAARPCPWPHLHVGLDMFAAEGTPVVAVAKGRITAVIDDDVTGLGIILSTRNGMQYLYAHLSRFAARATEGRLVRRGQVIGFVGNTGDAAGGPTHLHFQAEPGGIPMPPKPLVDRWLLRETREVRELLELARSVPPLAGMPLIEKLQPAPRP